MSYDDDGDAMSDDWVNHPAALARNGREAPSGQLSLTRAWRHSVVYQQATHWLWSSAG